MVHLCVQEWINLHVKYSVTFASISNFLSSHGSSVESWKTIDRSLTAQCPLIDRSLTAVKNRIDRFSRRRNVMTHLHPSFSNSRIAVNGFFHSGQ